MDYNVLYITFKLGFDEASDGKVPEDFLFLRRAGRFRHQISFNIDFSGDRKIKVSIFAPNQNATPESSVQTCNRLLKTLN